MCELLATAHTWRGGDGPYSLVPALGFLLTLALIRFVLKRPIGVVWLTVSLPLGTLFTTVGTTWGFTVATALWILTALLLMGKVGPTRGSSGRNGPD